jgi:hypothetical protein
MSFLNMADPYKKFVLKIKGNDYMTVAGRIKMFWDKVEKLDAEGSIVTRILKNTDEVVIKAKAIIKQGEKILSLTTGYASETVGEGLVNKTSALENAETSAIGRALGSLGLGLLGRGGVASAEEVRRAVSQQDDSPATEKQINYLTELAEQTGEALTKEPTDMSRGEVSREIDSLKKVRYGQRKEIANEEAQAATDGGAPF